MKSVRNTQAGIDVIDMKYYEMHEIVYQDLEAKGLKSWDKATSLEDMLGHSINRELEKDLENLHWEGRSALDLGTGSGTVALYLARKGLNVSGLDISKSAIKMAIENQKSLGLSANFEVADICEFEGPSAFDLIIDSSFLHCIVGDDREKTLRAIRKVMAPDGLFFLHTMIASTDMSKMLQESHLMLVDEVLFSSGPDHWDMDWRNIGGKKVFPHRQLRSLNNLERELRSFGFEIVEQRIKKNPGHPDLCIAWLRGV